MNKGKQKSMSNWHLKERWQRDLMALVLCCLIICFVYVITEELCIDILSPFNVTKQSSDISSSPCTPYSYHSPAYSFPAWKGQRLSI